MILYLIGMVSGINNGLQLALTTFPTGTVFSGIPTPVSICAEYIQANNTIFVYILTSTSIYILDVSTNSKTLIASGIPDATALKQFNTDLIVASNTNDQIYRATKTGALYSTINTVVSLKTFAIDNYGYIYYSDGGNTVYQVIASTHSLYITIGTNITSLTIDFNNYLYIADNSSNIYKVAPNGESVILGSGWIQSPKGIVYLNSSPHRRCYWKHLLN